MYIFELLDGSEGIPSVQKGNLHVTGLNQNDSASFLKSLFCQNVRS